MCIWVVGSDKWSSVVEMDENVMCARLNLKEQRRVERSKIQ